MDENIKNIIDLINQSALDDTIKTILVRDLQNEGLTEFLREQIKVYCLEGIKQLDELEKAQKILEQPSQPADPA
jgi:hypothetical protein